MSTFRDCVPPHTLALKVGLSKQKHLLRLSGPSHKQSHNRYSRLKGAKSRIKGIPLYSGGELWLVSDRPLSPSRACGAFQEHSVQHCSATMPTSGILDNVPASLYPYATPEQPNHLTDDSLAFLSDYTGHNDLGKLREHVLLIWRNVKETVRRARSFTDHRAPLKHIQMGT